MIKTVSLICLVSVALCFQGCAKTTQLKYKTTTLPLDDNNELEISNYPAGFPKTQFHIPYLLEISETPRQVNFQLFVKDRSKSAGKNPHVESIVVSSMSYQFPGQPPTVLLENYDHYFWMQANPNYNQSILTPVPYHEDGSLTIEVDLILNGEHHQFSEQVPAESHWYVYPLLMHALR